MSGKRTIPKRIVNAIEQRKRHAERLQVYDAVISEYCRKLGLTPDEAIYDSHILMYSEPYAASEETKTAISAALGTKGGAT